jgi:AcrR family transcriptional regulator
VRRQAGIRVTGRRVPRGLTGAADSFKVSVLNLVDAPAPPDAPVASAEPRLDPRTARAREAMLLAAERLFGERGIEAVSLREVGAAAGQRNNSAAQYHFGSRDGLVDAIFARRMGAIDARRREVLARLDAEGRGHDRRALLEAVLLPLAEELGHADGVSWYARFLQQVAFEPGFDVAAGPRRDVTAALVAVSERLLAQLGHLPVELRAQRLRLTFRYFVHSLADRERALEARTTTTTSTDLLVLDLVDTGDALLTAPVSTATALHLRGNR